MQRAADKFKLLYPQPKGHFQLKLLIPRVEISKPSAGSNLGDPSDAEVAKQAGQSSSPCKID